MLIGLLTAVHKDYFRVVNSRNLLFNDCGDRVAQLLHVELVPPYSQFDAHQEVLIVNTHLLFPHDSTLSIVRLQQVEFFDQLHCHCPDDFVAFLTRFCFDRYIRFFSM